MAFYSQSPWAGDVFSDSHTGKELYCGVTLRGYSGTLRLLWAGMSGGSSPALFQLVSSGDLTRPPWPPALQGGHRGTQAPQLASPLVLGPQRQHASENSRTISTPMPSCSVSITSATVAWHHPATERKSSSG